jgi:hypothetical protein
LPLDEEWKQVSEKVKQIVIFPQRLKQVNSIFSLAESFSSASNKVKLKNAKSAVTDFSAYLPILNLSPSDILAL